jgi:hypothetical protein
MTALHNQVFHSFHEEMQSEFPTLVKTKSLFFSLAESITQTLNVTSCYVCEGMNMGDHWPWEVKELSPQEPINEITLPSLGESIWLLKYLYNWKLLYLPSKRPTLHHGRVLDLLETKVLQ